MTSGCGTFTSYSSTLETDINYPHRPKVGTDEIEPNG